jgi:hypothetical protein
MIYTSRLGRKKTGKTKQREEGKRREKKWRNINVPGRKRNRANRLFRPAR